MADSTHTIEVRIDSTQARQGANQVSSALSSIGGAASGAKGGLISANNEMIRMSRSSAIMGQAMKSANDNIQQSDSSLIRMVKSIGGASLALAGMAALGGGIAGIALALTDASDKASLLEAKLRNATAASGKYAEASQAVRNIANGTRSDLTAIGDLYSKLAKQQANLGLTTDQVGQATSTFAKILQVSGATASESTASILQLGQALSKGILNGDEFASLRENAGDFIKIIAEAKGVTVASIAEMASKGKLSAQMITDALTNPEIMRKVEEQYGRIPVTFQNVRTGISNALVDIGGSIAKGLGINDSLAVMLANIQTWTTNALPYFTAFGQQVKAAFQAVAPIISGVLSVVGPILGLMATNLETVTRLAIGMGAAFATAKTMMALTLPIRQMIALGVATGSTGGLTAFFSGAVATATGAVNTFTASLLANPLTVIPTLLVAATAALILFSDKIKLPGQEFGRLNDYVRSWWTETKSRFSSIMSIVNTFGNVVKAVFGIFGVAGRKVFSDVLAWGNRTFSGVLKVCRDAFNGINGATGGTLGRIIDFLKLVWDKGSQVFNWFKENWSALPGMIGNAVTGTVNWVIDGIEEMANKGINALNKLIKLAQQLPGGERLTTVDPISLDSWRGSGERIRAGAEAGGRDRYNRWLQTNTQWDFSAYDTDKEPPTAPSGGGGGGGGGKPAKSTGETEAERQAKAMKEYWQGLTESADAARLLGGELEIHNSILEYRKILGEDEKGNLREISALDSKRITDAITLRATNAGIANLTQENADLLREGNMLSQEALLMGSMTADQVKNEMDIRRDLGEYRTTLERTHADMNDTILQSLLAQREAQLRINQTKSEALRLDREAATAGNALLERYDRARDPRAAALLDRNTRDSNIRKATKAPGETDEAFRNRVTMALADSAEEFSDDLTEVSKKFEDRMLGAVSQIGDAIGGEWGDAISKVGQAIAAMAAMARGDNSKGGLFGGIAELLGKGRNGELNEFGKSFAEGSKSVMSFGKQQSAAGYRSLTTLFSGKGDFMKNLGSVMGRAGGGMQVGSIVGSVGKLLNKNFSEKGSQIGGMIGSFIPIPGGSIIGSIAGGILGSIFGKKKAATSSSNISIGANGLTNTTTGNNAESESASNSAGQSVMDGINEIAKRLGVDATGMANVSIGKYKNIWKVSESGGTVGKKVGKDFGEDEGAAIKYAIQDAIKDGVLVGLSSFSDRLLKNAKNLDSALSLAESYENLLKELGQMKDPMGSAIGELTKNLNRMTDSMKKSGATSEELAKVEEFKSLKIAQILKDQISGLSDFRKSLSGEGSGVSSLNRLTAAQSEFSKMQSDILSGKTVDQDTFTKLGQEVFGLARDVFGSSSSQFQAIRQALMAATDGAITNATTKFNDAQVVAIDRNTDAVTANQVIQTDLLRQQNELLAQIASQGGFDRSGASAVNGVVRRESF